MTDVHVRKLFNGGWSINYTYTYAGEVQSITYLKPDGTTLATGSYTYFVQELSALGVSGTPTANLLTGDIDQLFMRSTPGATATLHWVLPEANNSTVITTDSSGTTQHSYAYDPYGNVSQSGTAETNTQQYTGRENDGTGLYYYRNRYYAPGCVRFISEDPIGWASGQTNNYAYAYGNPVQFGDPYGTCGWSDAIVGFGDAFGAGLIRDALSIETGPMDDGWYNGGMIAGTIWGLIPFALEEGAAYDATREGSQLLNRGQSLRIGPGRMPGVPAEGPLPDLPPGPKVPRIAVGGDNPIINPADRIHIDLRSRLPKPPPIGATLSGGGNGSGSGCP